MGWGHSAHVGPVEHHRNDILVQDLEELLRHVVLAERVLKGKVELVLVAEKVQAALFLPRRTVEIPTVAIDVNGGEIVDHVDQVLATNSAYTIREEYGRCQSLASLLFCQLLVFLAKLLNIFFQLVSFWRCSLLHKLAVDCGNAGVVPVRHRQVEEARNLVQYNRSSRYDHFKMSLLSG